MFHLWIADIEHVVQECDHVANGFHVVFAAVKTPDVVCDLVVNTDEIAAEYLFVAYCRFAQVIGYYVIDILDEDYGRFYIVEVLDQCAMTSRAEQQCSVILPERSAVGVCGDCVGR